MALIQSSLIVTIVAVISGCADSEPRTTDPDPPDAGTPGMPTPGIPDAPPPRDAPPSSDQAPAAPTGLAATGTSSETIRLTWTDSSMEETGFKIERAAAAAGPFSQVSVVGANATSYEDSGLTAAMTYHYRVKATNAAGDSAYTAVASAMTMPDTPDQICAPSETRCIAGDIGKFQRCNASGSAWEDPATCSGLSLCSDRQCRVVCEMTSTPVNPTLCLFPNRDGVNDGEWRFWTDSRLASPANTGGGSKADAGGQAPVINSGETWPHAWRISAVDFTFAQFKLNQFSFPRSQRLAFRAKREGVISNGTSNFFVGAFNGAGALISNCTFGPVPFSYITTSCLNGAPLGGRMSYDGSFNTMLLSITGSGVPDFLDVNWIKLSIEP